MSLIKKNVMEKKLDYDTLIKEWKNNRPDYEDFSDDGILIEEIWSQTIPKVLFLLKEPNSDFVHIRGNSYSPKSGNSHVFWRNINIWQYILSEFWNDRVPSLDKIKIVKEKDVNSIAYVNLKKCNENNSISKLQNIREYVLNDNLFLKRQLELINPDIILCCGTMKFYKELFSSQFISQNVYRTKDWLVVDFYHPSCRIGYKKTFDLLCTFINNEHVKRNLYEIRGIFRLTK